MSTWKNNLIQFPRLLAELYAIGLTDEQIAALITAMDLDPAGEELLELFERAQAVWDRIKTQTDPSRRFNAGRDA